MYVFNPHPGIPEGEEGSGEGRKGKGEKREEGRERETLMRGRNINWLSPNQRSKPRPFGDGMTL